MTIKEFEHFAIENENNHCRLQLLIHNEWTNTRAGICRSLLESFGQTWFICTDNEHNHGPDHGSKMGYKHSYGIIAACCAERIKISSFISEDDF